MSLVDEMHGLIGGAIVLHNFAVVLLDCRATCVGREVSAL